MIDAKYDAIAALEQFIQEGRSVIFPVKGYSMLPFIVGDRDKVEFYPIKDELQKGDIVMARVKEGYPVVHRIVGLSSDGTIVLSGDGNLGFLEHCGRRDVIALACYVVRPDGSKKSLRSKSALRKWRWWRAMMPFRRVLLKVYRVWHHL